MEYIINENMDRQSQMYDQGMMPYDMENGYGLGIMPDEDTISYESQAQMPMQGYMPYGRQYIPSPGIMNYGLYYMPDLYNMYYLPWIPYYPAYYPPYYGGHHYHRDEY